jgi:hypothetical protein
MAINSSSPNLGSALNLAQQVDAAQTAVNSGKLPDQANFLNQLQNQLVDTLLASSRWDLATVITNCSINTMIDPAVFSLISSLIPYNQGGNYYPNPFIESTDKNQQLKTARLAAIHNAVNRGTPSAATILATMS